MTTAKEWWKKHYRLLRIARRETLKAAVDTMLYGNGFITINDKGEAERLPPESIKIAIDPAGPGPDITLKGCRDANGKVQIIND